MPRERALSIVLLEMTPLARWRTERDLRFRRLGHVCSTVSVDPGLSLRGVPSPEQKQRLRGRDGDKPEAGRRRQTPLNISRPSLIASLDPDASSWAKAQAVRICSTRAF
jgi:hypothetical protein